MNCYEHDVNIKFCLFCIRCFIKDHPDVKVKRKTVVWQKRRLQQPACSAAFLQLGSHSKAQALKSTEPLIILTGHCPYFQSVPAGRN